MNKWLIAVTALLIIIPAIAMESNQSKKLLHITKEENREFLNKLNWDINSIEKYMISAQDTPFHVMLRKLNGYLCSCDINILKFKGACACGKDVFKMIKTHQLEERINKHIEMPEDYLMEFNLGQIESGCLSPNNPELAKTSVVRTRQIRSGLVLSKSRPEYQHLQWTECHTRAKMDFMMNILCYPVEDEEAVKDFIAFYLYYQIFAYRI